MKRIGIDARLYFKTGVGVYIRNLLHYLQEQSLNDFEFYIYVLQSDEKNIEFKSKNFIKRPVSYLWHSFSEQTGFSKTLNDDNLDLMHFTYYSYPVFYKRKFIATLHDTILLEHKTGKASTKSKWIYEMKHFVFRYVIESQIRNAEIIITPTQTVKQNILRLFGDTYEKKIMPIYEGVNYDLIGAEENKDLASKFSFPFFIYVGNFYPHKNVETLIRAYAKTSIDAKLVLIGPNDFFAQRISALISDLNQSDRIILFDNFSIENLVFFYKHAQALIHPSFSEGFGLPLIEAAYFNLPIIASDIDVFKEILKEQYLTFDPNNIGDLSKKIESFTNNKFSPDYRMVLKDYSFKSMTDQIYNLYRKFS